MDDEVYNKLQRALDTGRPHPRIGTFEQRRRPRKGDVYRTTGADYVIVTGLYGLGAEPQRVRFYSVRFLKTRDGELPPGLAAFSEGYLRECRRIDEG